MSEGVLGRARTWGWALVSSVAAVHHSNRQQLEEDSLQVENRHAPNVHTFLHVLHGLDGARDGCMESSREGRPKFGMLILQHSSRVQGEQIHRLRCYRGVATDSRMGGTFWTARTRFYVSHLHPFPSPSSPPPCEVVHFLCHLLQLGLCSPWMGGIRVSADLSMWWAWCKHELGGLYIKKLPLTANAENLIKVNKIIKIALIMWFVSRQIVINIHFM